MNTKKSLRIILSVLIVSMILAIDCYGEPASNQRDWHKITPNITVGGSLRLRFEVKDDFNFQDKDEDYFLSQLRLNFKYEPRKWFSLFIEGQDAHIYEEENIDEESVPNIFSDEMDIHQGYMDFKFSRSGIPIKVRAGRQKFNLGTKRLVASLEWVNTARVWDGVRVTIGKAEERTLELISSRLVAVDPDNLNDWAKTKSRLFNSDFHIIYFTDKVLIPNSRIEAYWIFRHEDDVEDSVHTVGARGETKAGLLKFDGEIAFQFGDYGDDDQKAYMIHIGSAYHTKWYGKPVFGIAYNIGSGDDDPTDGDHETFDNLFPLNHAYYGFMDLFSLQNMHNLEATVKGNVYKDLKLRLAYQGFWLDEEDDDAWYNAGAGVVRNANGKDVDSYVGSEVDVTLTYPYRNIVFEVNYSHFFTGSYIEDTGHDDDADFVYVQTKIIF